MKLYYLQFIGSMLFGQVKWSQNAPKCVCQLGPPCPNPQSQRELSACTVIGAKTNWATDDCNWETRAGLACYTYHAAN